MSPNFADLCNRAGVRASKPLAESSRKRLFSKLGCEIPKEVVAFYQSCNGGRLPSLNCRFYPLAEAVDLSGAWDFLVSFRLLPLFESENNTSDPCMVGLDGPLAGYVFQICHDGPSRVHAPSIAALLKGLATKSPEEFVTIEDTSFVYPKELSAAEKRTVQKLIARSKTELETDDEPSLLMELALSMMTDDECLRVFEDINHPHHNAQHQIEFRFKQINSPQAKRALNRQEKEVKSFVKKALQVLKKNGFTATTSKGTDIYVEEGEMHLNVPMFFENRNSPACWDQLLERVRYLSSDEDEGETVVSDSPPLDLSQAMRPSKKLYEQVTRKVTFWTCDICEEEELADHPTLGDATSAPKTAEWYSGLGQLAMEQGWLVIPVEGDLEFQIVGPGCAEELAN